MALTSEEFQGRETLAKWIIRRENIYLGDLKVVKVWHERLLELVEELGEYLEIAEEVLGEREEEILIEDFDLTVEEIKKLLDY